MGLAALFCDQCNNDNDHGSESLSVVLRGYCIEHLIRQGVRELVIWSETGPPLSRYVTYLPSVGVHVDVPSYPWRVVSFLASKVAPWLPKRLGKVVQWFICFFVAVQTSGWISALG